MVVLNASCTGVHSLSDNVHAGAVTPGLRFGGGSLGNSNAGSFNACNLPPPTASQTIRDRQILEQLLTVAKIATASSVADDLLHEYGTLAAALSASLESKVIDPVSALLSSVQQALIESVRPKVADRKRLSSAADVIEYLIVAMANLPIEVVRVLFLDIQNRLIRDEIVGRGSVSEAPIYPREILKRSLALGATALILAHNHPSGDPEPSEADILATHRLATAGAELGIAVHDHIIVGQAGWVSMRDNEQFQDQG